MKLLQRMLGILSLAIGVLVAMPAVAEYPERPISIIVPAAPGGTTDALARVLARFMSNEVGQNMVVENVGGAGGSVGMQRVANATPDGYTLSFGNMGQIGANPAVYPDLRFDPRRDFVPVGIVADVPMVMAVSNASGIEDLDGFVAWMRENPGNGNFGSSGPGSTGYLAPLLFLKQNGLEAEILTYQGAGPALLDLMAGLIEGQIDQTVMMAPVHADKSARIIAVTGESAPAGFEDVPTFSQQGYPEFDLVVWNGLAAPADVPPEVQAKLETALLATLRNPQFIAQVENLGAAIPTEDRQGATAFGGVIEQEVERWFTTLEVAQN